MFAVYDGAVRAYLQPFFSPTKAGAIRSFADAVQAEGSQFAKRYADFHLSMIGSFDDGSGGVEGCNPERVIGASECLPGDDVFPPGRKVS